MATIELSAPQREQPFLRRTWELRYVRALRSWRGGIGCVIVAAIVLAGLVGPLVDPYSPVAQSLNSLRHPSPAHPLGTDELGRDLLVRVLAGIRVDLVVAVVGVPVGAVAGTGLALLAAGARGWIDVAIQRLFDVILAFPILILAIAIAAILGSGLTAILVAVTLATIPTFGRLARASVLAQRNREYVIAASTVGVGPARLLIRHILPNVADALIVQMALSMSFAVFIESAMSFLGVGIQLPEPSLGSLLEVSRTYLTTHPNYALGPAVILAGLVVGLNLVADALNMGTSRR